MMTWNGTGPYNPNIDPITYSEFLALSFHEVEAMTAMGMPGVSTWNFGEAFAHLYLDSVAMNHNSIGRGYETFGNGSAETEKRAISPSATTMEWYRPLPAGARSHVVGSRQSQLSGNRRAGGIGRNGQRIQRHAAQLLQEVMGLLAERPDAAALCVSDSGRSRRPGTRCSHGRSAHGAAHRSVAGAESDSDQRRQLPCRNLCRAARPAVSQLRSRPAHAAALSEGWRPTLRRRVLGASRQLSFAGDTDGRRVYP